MKTNQVMTRPIGQFNVEQRTKDAKFNATALLRQWNDFVEKETKDNLNTDKSKYLKKKDIYQFLDNENTKMFILALKDEENIKKDADIIEKVRGKNGGTYMNPYLFFKFAMWLNPKFEVQVIKFVHDQMIAYRNEAGDAYKVLGTAVSKITDKGFLRIAISNISKAVNWVVFNHHEKMVRNKFGEEGKMKELFSLERKLADLIDDGFITSYEQLINYLRKKWIEKWQPKELTIGGYE